MKFKTKAFDATIQGAGDSGLEDGVFTAIVSTYNPDSYGDIVAPGAFSDSIAEYESKGAKIPVIWAHDWGDPFSHIGVVEKAEETEKGLKVTGYISPEERETNPKAAQIWRLMKARRVTQFSFAFDTLEGGWIEKDGMELYELRKMKIHEVGPCLLGVNQETELLTAKAMGLKNADLGAKALKELREAYEVIGQILDVTPEDHSPEKEVEGGPKTEDAANPDAGPASNSEPVHTPKQLLEKLDLELAIAEVEML